ncbi:DeoR/GlpR family DNA-binding transcription regulator [Agrilactobacillus yilanensis]|uniref:DeoR/GlpR family DNA-binding transcription regulator n=1 Tax=Agrilactobacillus yilanensis TaxID=2485997 RepID=A0ABW4J5M8_9LACO|nr:DeoR/GlpR family DNA-binding transcription regulator [Agrilactobacillus yilanensis]
MKADEIQRRREAILAMLQQQKKVKVSALVKMFGVSDETIRKDLRILENQGLLVKKFGQAILTETKPLAPVSQRTTKLLQEKQRIAAAAIALLPKTKAAIALDQGSTVAALAQALNEFDQYTIMTSSLLALIALQNTRNELYTPGGHYNLADMSFQSSRDPEVYGQIHLDFCFLGSSGVSGREGFCSSSFEDSKMKKLLLKNSVTKVLLIDESKFSQSSLVQVGTWADVDYVVTNLKITAPEVKAIKAQTRLILV